MTSQEQLVKQICDEVYHSDVQQITIDLVQDTIEELFFQHGEVKPDAVGAAAYETSILLEAFNPAFEKDIGILTRLYRALNDWQEQLNGVHKILNF